MCANGLQFQRLQTINVGSHWHQCPHSRGEPGGFYANDYEIPENTDTSHSRKPAAKTTGHPDESNCSTVSVSLPSKTSLH